MEISQVQRASFLALWYHYGKKDLQGNDYFGHLERVAFSCHRKGFDIETVCAAYLHDILEDTECSLERLKAIFPDQVVEAVVAITKREGEPYVDYLERVKSNKIARVVKVSDLEDNMSETRQPKNPTKKDLARQEKYQKALKFLNEV